MQTIAESWIAEGRVEGRVEGRAEGRVEGRVEALQDTLLNLLQIRFGYVPEGVSARVRGAQDEGLLQAWFEKAATAVSLSEFQQTLDH